MSVVSGNRCGSLIANRVTGAEMGGTYRIEKVPAAWILGHNSVREGIPPEVLIPVGEQ